MPQGLSSGSGFGHGYLADFGRGWSHFEFRVAPLSAIAGFHLRIGGHRWMDWVGKHHFRHLSGSDAGKVSAPLLYPAVALFGPHQSLSRPGDHFISALALGAAVQ